MKLVHKLAVITLVVFGAGLATLAFVLSHSVACKPPSKVAENSASMKAMVSRCYGSPEVVTLELVEKPVPAPDEVLIKVRAASVNPLDWHYMRGSPYIMRLESGLGAPTDPRMGVDFSGTVEAIGDNVSQFQPGDDVFGGVNGAFAEFLVIRESRGVVRKPPNISFEQAAAVPIAAITALQALRDKGSLQPGQHVLINGASGGVGTFAVQIAKAFGAEVTGVCSTRNVTMVRSLGADHVIDYTKEDYTAGGRKYDLIIDNIGNHSLLANGRVLGAQGTLVMVGAQGSGWLGPLMRPLQALLLSPFVAQSMVMIIAELNQNDLNTLGDLIQANKIVPVIDRRYALSEVPAAIRYSETGRAQGKIIITLEK